MKDYTLLATGIVLGALLRPLVEATVALWIRRDSGEVPDNVDRIARFRALPPVLKEGE